MGAETSKGLPLVSGQDSPHDLPTQAPNEFVIPKSYEPSVERRRSSTFDKLHLGNINATIYQTSLDFDDKKVADPPPLGSLSFDIIYEEYEQQLIVHVISSRRLPVRHEVKEEGGVTKYEPIPCETFLTVCLLPDKKPVLETYAVPDTRDPEFRERFVFKLTPAELNEKTIRFSLYDSRWRHKLVPIGHVLYALKGRELGVALSEEKEIGQHSVPYGHSRGYMLVSLRFIPALGKIKVEIIEARHLFHYDSHSKRAMEEPGTKKPDDVNEYFVKIIHVQADHKIKTKRTPICEGERKVIFNHSVMFPVSVSQLSDMSLIIILMDHGIVRNNKVVGRVVLGPYVFVSDNEQSHWGRMVARPLKKSEQWHPLQL